jgi:restriction endonuclease S subunit
MNNFQLSEQADPNKIFLTKFSELEGRFDPLMVLYQRKIKKFKFETKAFSQLLKNNPQYGANEVGIDRKLKNEPRYIRITDIDKYGLLKNNLGKTAEVLENQYLLSNNNILIARSGATVGKAYIHKTAQNKNVCFYAGYMIRFIVDESQVKPDYIFYYTQLNVYKEWVNAIQRASGQPNINAEEYKSLKIPIPPKNIQADIVAKMDKAYQDKKK